MPGDQRQTTACECGRNEACPFVEGCDKVERDDEACMAEPTPCLQYVLKLKDRAPQYAFARRARH